MKCNKTTSVLIWPYINENVTEWIDEMKTIPAVIVLQSNIYCFKNSVGAVGWSADLSLQQVSQLVLQVFGMLYTAGKNMQFGESVCVMADCKDSCLFRLTSSG